MPRPFDDDRLGPAATQEVGDRGADDAAATDPGHAWRCSGLFPLPTLQGERAGSEGQTLAPALVAAPHPDLLPILEEKWGEGEDGSGRHPNRLRLSSCTSSKVRSPVVGALDEDGHVAGLVLVLPHARVRLGDLLPREDLRHAGVDAALHHQLVGLRGLQEVGEVRALHALLVHPQIARVHGEVVARGAGADHHHAAALDDQHRDRKRRRARMLEHEVDVVALAGDLPDGGAELARLLEPGVVLGRCRPWAARPSS